MKISCLVLLVLTFTAACAHKANNPPRPEIIDGTGNGAAINGNVEGIRIKVMGFLTLTSDDLTQLELNIKSDEEKDLALSNAQTARCQEGVCHIARTDFDGEINGVDLQKFAGTIKKAQGSKKEERFTDGPVTLRCVPEQCVADFNLDGHQLHNTSPRGQAKESDIAGYLLSGFVTGMVGAAHGSNR